MRISVGMSMSMVVGYITSLGGVRTQLFVPPMAAVFFAPALLALATGLLWAVGLRGGGRRRTGGAAPEPRGKLAGMGGSACGWWPWCACAWG